MRLLVRERGLRVATGRFGAHIAVDPTTNDGPVTLVLTDEPGA